MQNLTVTSKVLKEEDVKIRQFVKKIIKLIIHVSNHALYGSIKRGRLGIFEMATNIPGILKRRIDQISNISSDMDMITSHAHTLQNKLEKNIKTDLDTKLKIKEHHNERLEMSFCGNAMVLFKPNTNTITGVKTLQHPGTNTHYDQMEYYYPQTLHEGRVKLTGLMMVPLPRPQRKYIYKLLIMYILIYSVYFDYAITFLIINVLK